ncbi:hypothetical protein AVEN_181971-1 [Araneus ventricosus]|uniref:Uncharacterized protein n=1 Tax=Araneus ventricosus TaxID=182803 RepID=A0A4Y2JRZ5_ARAVE|nr:hypothetical protein AVEN_181971-1 [Araneus ventricosus]
MACCYHDFEIMFETVVVKSIEVSTGPNILMFKRFKNSSISIDLSDFETAISDDSIHEKVINSASRIIEFAENQFEEFQPRYDYTEFLELTTIFPGVPLERGIRF